MWCFIPGFVECGIFVLPFGPQYLFLSVNISNISLWGLGRCLVFNSFPSFAFLVILYTFSLALKQGSNFGGLFGWVFLPGVTKECFLEALKYLKISKQHPFEPPGRFLFGPVVQRLSESDSEVTRLPWASGQLKLKLLKPTARWRPRSKHRLPRGPEKSDINGCVVKSWGVLRWLFDVFFENGDFFLLYFFPTSGSFLELTRRPPYSN